MTTPSSVTSTAATVVASYDDRVQFARAETAAARPPILLGHVLDTASHVAEIPCGAGHFLAHYAQARIAVTLVDANAAMLAEATTHALAVGIRLDRIFAIHTYLHDLVALDEVDLVVMPNGALNQLSSQAPLIDLLTHLRTTLPPDTRVLAQVACANMDNPARRHGVWLADRWLEPTFHGPVLRRSRQHRNGNILRIEFAYRSATDTLLHTSTIELTLFSAPQLTEAFTAAGFTDIRFLPGRSGLSEILAVVAGQR
jgi:cyclopropane fatty-acyl-phospholipid synthase-like methyltransferase